MKKTHNFPTEQNEEDTVKKLNVFGGSRAVLDFMDPDNHPPIPLVELPECLNPFFEKDVCIFAKTMYVTPLLNLKLLPALNMLLGAESSGELKNVHTLVEASSGNTVFCLAILAPFFGIKRVMAIVPSDIAPGKLELLRLSGAQITLHKDEKESAIAKARRLGKRKGFLNLAQYENEANPKAHEQWTAEQVWKQTDGKLNVFCAGLGTAGTVAGASECFRKKGGVAVVGVACAPESAVPGVRTKERLK